MRPSLGVAKKDFLLFIRDRATLFWVLAFPLMMMLLFSSVFGEQEARFDVACVDMDEGGMATALIEALNSTEVISLHKFESEEKAIRAVKAGEKDMVGLLVIPEGFTDNLTSGAVGNLEFYIKEGDTTVQQMLTSFMSGFIEEFNSRFRKMILKEMMESMPENMSFGGYVITREEMIKYMVSFAKPINITMASISKQQVTSGTAAYWENKGQWVATMLVYSFLFSGMVSSTWTLVEEKENKTLKRLKVSTASTWSLLSGKILSALLTLSFSQVVLVLTTLLVLRPDVNWNLSLFPLILMGDISGVSLGLLIAEISPSPRAAGQAATVIGVILQFFIGIYFPVQFLPGVLRTFSELLPFTKAAEALSAVLVQGASMSQVVLPSIYLGVSAVVFMTLAVALFPRWALEE